MKNLFSVLKYTPKRTLAVLATIAAVIVPAAVFAWGPSRTTFTTAVPASYVTFNSIVDNPAHGDERNFAQVRDVTASDATYSDTVNVTPGHEYLVNVYFHNNAAANLNLVATGSYVKIELPAVATNGVSTKAVAYVGAENANPTQVWDDFSFNNTTGGNVAIRYIPGSAKIHSFGKVDGQTMSDNIVTNGAAIGYSALDGRVPGCNDYAGYVTFKVVADQPNFTVNKQVRKTGTTTWLDSMNVATGDSVDYLITYKNTGTTQQNDVVVKDVLPTGVTYSAETTYVANTTNPSGVKVSNKIVEATGINIGNYAAGSAAYIKFSAKVTATNTTIDCGVNNLTNTAKVETNNGSRSDTAVVVMTKTCTTPPTNPTKPELPKTGMGETIATILGLGSIVTSAAYYVNSRRAKFNQ